STDLYIGNRLTSSTLTTVDTLCVAVPRLENRGKIVTPKIFSKTKTDVVPNMVIRYRPLKLTDSIIVKQRNKDVIGLPTLSQSDGANWTGRDEFYTTDDLSEAKTYLDSGKDLEIEFISGV